MIYLNAKEKKATLKNREYILDCIILLVIIQIARVIIKHIFLSQFNLTLENLNIINIISIMIIGVSVAFIFRGSELFNSAGQRLINLNNKYTNKNIRLVSGGITSIAFIIYLYFKDGYLKSNLIVFTLYLIIQPIFEEVILREYMWNYLKSFQKNERKVLLMISLLSAIFKIGYWDIVSQNLSVVGSSYFTIDIIISKVLFGFIIAFVLGIIKIKYKDIYLCIFTHSFINIVFAR